MWRGVPVIIQLVAWRRRRDAAAAGTGRCAMLTRRRDRRRRRYPAPRRGAGPGAHPLRVVLRWRAARPAHDRTCNSAAPCGRPRVATGASCRLGAVLIASWTCAAG